MVEGIVHEIGEAEPSRIVTIAVQTMDVVFLHGPPAAGKLTLGRRLAERLGIPLFHNHLTVDLVATLFPFGSPGFVALRERIWLEAFQVAARAGRSFVFTFNPEATVDPELVGHLEQAVTTAGGRVLYVELRCSEGEIERRLGDASRARFGKLTDLGLYHQIRATGGFDFPALPPPVVVIDTSETSVEEAVERIEKAVLGERT